MRSVSRYIAGIVLLGLSPGPAVYAQAMSFLDVPSVAVPDFDTGGVSTDIVVVPTIPITNVSVMLRIDHPDTGQLEATLEHVDTATTVTLCSIIGGTLPGTGEDNDSLWVVLTEDALLPADLAETVHPAPTSIEGSFRSDDPLSAFDGESTVGTWRLTVKDLVLADTGTLAAWSISFNSQWTDMGLGKPGFSDTSQMVGLGDLTALSPYSVSVTGAEPLVPGFVFFGATLVPYPFPFKGGFLGPPPFLIPIVTDGIGKWTASGTWPSLVRPGTELYLQYWYQDFFSTFGVAATNTVALITP